jgi:hypothetical protein
MTEQSGPPQSNVKAMIRGLAWDVGLPVVTYYALHLLGYTDLVALLVAAAAAALRIVWVAVRERTLSQFAAVMLVIFGGGFLLSLISGDPRFLLVKGSIVSGAVGILFLALRSTRPLTLAAQQSQHPSHAQELADEYRTEPAVRAAHKKASTVWGVGLLLEAAVRIPLIFLLPVEVMVGLSTAMQIAVIAVLVVWTARFTKRVTIPST